MLKEITDICRVVERRNAIPILDTVRISPMGNGFVTLQGTDLDSLLTLKCGVNHSGFSVNGVCVGAYALLNAVKAIGADIALRINPDGQLVVFNNKQSITVKGMFPGNEFPEMPTRNEQWLQSYSPIGEELASGLAYCKTVMSIEETRYYLNGVCLQLKGSEWTLVATDGHRLRCVKSNESLPHGEHDQSLIIPRKTIVNLLGMKRKVIAVFVSPDENYISFTFNDGSAYSSKLIAGSFPSWENVVPNGDGLFLTFADKKDAIKTVKGMIRFIGKDIGVKIEPGVTLTMHNDENEMVSTVKGKYDGESFGVNANYLVQELADSDSELKFIVKDYGSPIITMHNGDCKRFGILMPLRIK